MKHMCPSTLPREHRACDKVTPRGGPDLRSEQGWVLVWQVAWLRQKLGPEEGGLVAALKWLGVLTDDPSTPLETALRYKCLILVAVTLKRRSLR
jgi:hypothetical protein